MDQINWRKILIGIAVAILAGLGVTYYVAQDPGQPPTPTPTPTATASPTPAPTASPSPSPSPTPSPTATASPAPTPSPTPTPTPSPTPTAAPAPKQVVFSAGELGEKPWPGTTPAFNASVRIGIGRNERRGFVIAASDCTQIAPKLLPTGVTVQFFWMPTIKTTVPSYKGAPVGDWHDPLVPFAAAPAACLTSYVWARVAVDKTVTPGLKSFLIGDLPVTLSVWNFTQPDVFPEAYYSEQQASNIAAAHGLAQTGDTLKARADLARQYRELSRFYSIEPIKQAVMGFRPADFDQWKDYGASFRQTTLENTLYSPCLDGPNPGNPPPASFVMAAINARPDGWFYPFDEGEGTLDAQALAAAQAIKTADARAIEYITRNESAAFNPYIDAYIIAVNVYKPATRVKPFGLYVSCMANGNCSNHTDATQVGAATAAPMMVADAATIQARIFPIVARKLGAQKLLYFNETQRLATALNAGGGYNEGGNQDGTLVYAGRKGYLGLAADQPLPSLRLEMQLQGRYDAEYLRKNPAAFQDVVTDQYNWTKSHVAIDAAREKVGAAL